MRTAVMLTLAICCMGSTAWAQRPDLINCPCGPDWLIGSDRALVPQSWKGADFRAACNRHDACLSGCCVNRLQCDRQFYRDLRQACRYSSNPAECRRVARLMYRAVRGYGGRELSPQEKVMAVARLRQINARYGRYVPPEPTAWYNQYGY